MSEPQHDQVACPHCGKLHRWTSATATRSIRCACGKPMLMPDAPSGRAIPVSGDTRDFELAPEADDAPPAPAPPRTSPAGPARPSASADADLYSLAPEDEDDAAPPAPPAPAPTAARGAAATRVPLPPLPRREVSPTRCPSCNQPLKPGTVVCVNCGYHVQVGMLLETARPPSDPDAPPGEEDKPLTAVQKALAERVDNVTTHDMRDYHAPIILMVVGLLWRLVYETMWDSGEGILNFLRRTVLDAALIFPLLLVALLVVAALFKTTFGSLTATAVKVLAIILLTAIIGDIMTAWLGPLAFGFGMILTLSLLLGAAMTMFVSLFDLDITEAITSAVVLILIQYLFVPLLLYFVLPMMGIWIPYLQWIP